MNQNLMRAGVRLVADRIMIFCSRSYLWGWERQRRGTAEVRCSRGEVQQR